jgi:hypothetical protein
MSYCPECGQNINDPKDLIQHMITEEGLSENDAISRLLSIGLINIEDI